MLEMLLDQMCSEKDHSLEKVDLRQEEENASVFDILAQLKVSNTSAASGSTRITSNLSEEFSIIEEADNIRRRAID